MRMFTFILRELKLCRIQSNLDKALCHSSLVDISGDVKQSDVGWLSGSLPEQLECSEHSEFAIQASAATSRH